MDAKRTIVPSWMGSPPSHAGSKRAGKLSADEWRAFLIYCMITLIPLWTAKGGRYLLMLENFMDLVMAIKLGTSRSISLGQPEAYIFYMKCYLTNLFKLFPESSFKPNHHASLHDGNFLGGLGPVHSWSTWVFERLNALMQSISTSSIPGQSTPSVIVVINLIYYWSKTGEMESTMMNAFGRTANLRAMFQEGGPIQLADMRPPFREAFDSNNRGSLYHDIRAFESTEDTPYTRRGQKWVEIPAVVRSAFAAPITGFSIPRLSHSGVSFTASSTSTRDCNIMFRDGSNDIVPGIIDNIFSYDLESGEEAYAIVIKSFDPVSDPKRVSHDCYRRWKPIAGALYEKHPTIQAIQIDAVMSHAARRPYIVEGHEYLHFLPCDKVGYNILMQKPDFADSVLYHRTCFGKTTFSMFCRMSMKIHLNSLEHNAADIISFPSLPVHFRPNFPFLTRSSCMSTLYTFS